ncbi:hypothetical protein CY34DRAFT_808061 [Suillus luteus UH-Slu-Lm8-n1]|uniref:DUF6533 domain-containing protein n=1 Tax=Suillus luteus UH-Slu-Lm8-n1 TaxID=930992 RepID=A0A0D0ANP3_9AGAM|nr:hypothetical protein CY34DRAFT_808061 [Suillus luteus UH-Slu-Lm8-n1]
MVVVLNDPSLWPMISWNMFLSYWTVAAGVMVVYDWALTFEQEIELIWRQRWSLMTVLYLVIRYIGIPYYVCNIMSYIMNGTNVVVTALLGVIMITRLYAMYQRSRITLIFLVIIFLAVNITCGVITAILLQHSSTEELILSGTYMCDFGYEEDDRLLASMTWTLNTVWEVLALCLSVWIAVKHFRDLQRLGPSTGSFLGNLFRVLIKSHVLYFASFVGVSCLELSFLSPEISKSHSIAVEILFGALQIFLGMQTFVLGPRLILSVRECHAKLVADFDAEASMNSIAFQKRVHVPTSSTV